MLRITVTEGVAHRIGDRLVTVRRKRNGKRCQTRRFLVTVESADKPKKESR
ncbi:MAG: hypothetical protein ACYCQK_01290 [Acidiferrobacteraceae bacterium]